MHISIPHMLLSPLLLTLTLSQKIYQGFNSGSTLTSRAPKTESDFTLEFTVAQTLHSSPGTFSSARLYTNIQASTTTDPLSAFPAAIKTNTSLLLGIWCSGTTSIANELSALKKAIDTHGDALRGLVVGVSVGSEDLYRISESGVRNKAGLGKGPDAIVGFIKETRDFMKTVGLGNVLVGHVDTWSAWANSSNEAVIEASDFIGTDLYPYYEDDKDNTIDNAKSIFSNILNQTTNVAGKKPVWITETGWPVSGPNFGKAVASRDNAERYWREIGCGLFGRTNTWWYNLRDSNPDNEAKFAIVKPDGLETKELGFNLTCPIESGAPAAVNLEEDTDKKGKGSDASRTGVLGIGVAAGFVVGIVGLGGWL